MIYKIYYQSCNISFLYRKDEKVFIIKIYNTSTIADIKKQLNI